MKIECNNHNINIIDNGRMMVKVIIITPDSMQKYY